MREIKDQIILITGSTDGLGKKIAIDLARQDATILLHGRNPEKGKAALREVRAAGSRQSRYYNADLASLDAVRRLAREVQSKHDRIDVLINNAGIGPRSPASQRELSIDGYELHFAVNYLAPFLLTCLLLPLIRKSAPARIVNVSSVGQQAIDFEDLMMEKSYDDLKAYRRSKLAQIMFTIDLAHELKGSTVTVNCLHPASLMNTNMTAQTGYFSHPLSTVEEGAEAVEYVATSAEMEGISGEYFNGKMRSRAIDQAYDDEARRLLREWSGRFTRIDLQHRGIAA